MGAQGRGHLSFYSRYTQEEEDPLLFPKALLASSAFISVQTLQTGSRTTVLPLSLVLNVSGAEKREERRCRGCCCYWKLLNATAITATAGNQNKQLVTCTRP